MVVARTRKTTNHLRHILLGGLLTGGIWWFTGYPICAWRNRRARYVTVTEPSPYVQGPRGGLISSSGWAPPFDPQGSAADRALLMHMYRGEI